MNNANFPAFSTARDAVTSATDTFLTGTLLPLASTLQQARQALDPSYPTMGGATPEAAALYRAVVVYVNARAAKNVAGFSQLQWP